MTQENKDLLLKYLCMALPYGVKVRYTTHVIGVGDVINIATLKSIDLRYEVPILSCFDGHEIYDIKMDGQVFYNVMPYLRPISSMTEEELCEFRHFSDHIRDTECKIHIANYEQINWFLKNHFDFMGLIEKNLALNCTGLHIYDNC